VGITLSRYRFADENQAISYLGHYQGLRDDPSYPYGTGGAPGPKDVAAKKWWGDRLDRSVKDANGVDGWTLQAEF
jgi:hypothetical protein